MAMALQPMLLDTLGTACHVSARLYHYMLKEVSATVQQELLMAPILAPQSVEARQAMKPMKAAPELVKVVSVPPKPQASKPSLAVAPSKPS